MTENYSVLEPFDYLADIQSESSTAKKRVWTQSMCFEPGKVTNAISDVLITAAGKGLDVRLRTDWFNIPKANGEQKEEIYSRLRQNGVDVLITNPPSILDRFFPYHGRNHIKMTIIDNIAYIGGVNYSDQSFEFNDFMVKITDKAIVDVLVDVYMDDDKQSDKLIKIDDTTTVMVDSGKKPKSIIFDTTIQAVADAKSSIYFISQLIPDGKFLNALFNAYRDKKDVIVIAPKNNSFSHMFSLLNKINRFAMNIKKHYLPIIFLDKMLHAKLTIIDKHLVVFGSHNMSQKGVRMKTTEIAIMSTNSKLVNNLCEYFDKLKQP